MFSNENIQDLVKLIDSKEPNEGFEKAKYALQVHTQGYFYMNVLQAYKHDDKESIGHLIKTYKPITKGSIWKGVDNISRTFHKTGIKVNGNYNTIRELTNAGFFTDYIEKFINVTTTLDPNSVSVWLKEGNDYKLHFVETEDIIKKTDDFIFFINPKSKYREVPVYENHEQYKLEVGSKKEYRDPSYIYISDSQYIEINVKDRIGEAVIFPSVGKPYTETGINPSRGIRESPLEPFLAFGDYALLQHRTLRAVDSMYSYPRMTELEYPCKVCTNGNVPTKTCEEYPDGIKKCDNCKGSGTISIQSVHKVYTKRIDPDNENLNSNIPSVEFHTPPIEILQYNRENWQESLKKAEELIYIPQRTETGNIESFKSKEHNMQAMYSWLDRISIEIYQNIQDSANEYCIKKGREKISIEKPISFAILGEFEAFDYLNSLINSSAPIFIKTHQIEDFLNKYISKTNPIHHIVNVLKKVDIFCFYSKEELKLYSNSSVINDSDWKTNAYAFPLLMQLYTKNPDILENEESTITQLTAEINTKMRENVPAERV